MKDEKRKKVQAFKFLVEMGVEGFLCKSRKTLFHSIGNHEPCFGAVSSALPSAHLSFCFTLFFWFLTHCTLCKILRRALHSPPRFKKCRVTFYTRIRHARAFSSVAPITCKMNTRTELKLLFVSQN